jgi:hypothetical protein
MPNQLIPLDRSEKCRFWQQVIDAQAQSGLFIHQYCQINNISKSSFYKWRGRLKKSKATSQIQFAEVISITPPKASSNNQQSQPLKIQFHQLSIEIPPGFDPATIHAVLETIWSRSC